MRKTLRILLWIPAVLMLLYFSLDIRKLDQYRENQPAGSFDPEAYTRDLWVNRIPGVAGSAPELGRLMGLLEADPEGTMSGLGHKLGISETWYFMARGTGTVLSVEEEFVLVSLQNDRVVELATAFIFGNEVRDGSGAVNIDDFMNMTEFNQVSVALNRLVKEEVVPGLIASAAPGREIEFAGAFAVTEDRTEFGSVRMIPVSIKFYDDRQ